MAERKERICRLIAVILFMTLLDAVFTAAGIRLGSIGEANPLLSGIVQRRPELSAAAAFLYTCALMAVVYRLGPRCKCTVPLLYALSAVKAFVIVLHAGWILTV